MSCLPQGPGDAPHVVAPAAFGQGPDLRQREGVLLVVVQGVGVNGVRLRGGGHGHGAVDGQGQDVALVVVGVLADEVDAPGRLGDQPGGPAEAAAKGI